MLKIIPLISYSALTFIVIGCSSQPQSVKANLPLVNANFALQHDKTKAKAIPELKVAPGQTVVVDKQRYNVSPPYTSALGKVCYRLTRATSAGSTQVRPLCKESTYWLLFPSLVSNEVQ